MEKVSNQDSQKLEIVTGQVTRRVFYSPDTGFTVFKLLTPSYANEITCTGHLPPHLFPEGEIEGCEVEISGSWTTTKYGRQFQFKSLKLAGEDEFSFFLKLIKGIGPKILEAINTYFSQKELVYILEKDPERLLVVPGIGPKKLELIKESWAEAKKFRGLYGLFERTGAAQEISPALLIKIYKHFEKKGLNPVLAIERDPYCLVQIKGIGFKTADRIALAAGVSPEDKRRFIAGVHYVLEKVAENEGHTFLTKDECRDAVKAELYSDEKTFIPSEKIDEMIEELFEQPPDFLTVEGDFTGLKKYRYMESCILDEVSALSRKPAGFSLSEEETERLISLFEEEASLELEPEQKCFLKGVLSGKSRVFSLVGYAGTGKTTALKALLHCLVEGDVLDPGEIACCAFTGMAARRIKDVTGFPHCYTIHSLLGYQREGGFIHGPANPLPQRLVILDEASMVNLFLFYSLIRALDPCSVFIMVGDPAQLPPIGAGNVFSDLISLKLVPVVELKKIKRQSDDSAITLIANEIRQGRFPEEYLNRRWQDFAWLPLELQSIWAARSFGASQEEIARIRNKNNEAIKDFLIRLVRKCADLGKTEFDVQVLSPMRMGILGTQTLNAELQEIFNPRTDGKQEFERKGIRFRVGDKVINLENRDVALQDGGWTRILNGQIGKILEFLPDQKQVLIEMFDVTNYTVVLDMDDLGKKIDLAYCLTVHKAQGSQYPIVIIPMTSSHWYMLNSQWLYTAVTRAYEKTILLGERRAFKRAATNQETKERKTWMRLG